MKEDKFEKSNAEPLTNDDHAYAPLEQDGDFLRLLMEVYLLLEQRDDRLFMSTRQGSA